jgi:hypothetical protein
MRAICFCFCFCFCLKTTRAFIVCHLGSSVDNVELVDEDVALHSTYYRLPTYVRPNKISEKVASINLKVDLHLCNDYWRYLQNFELALLFFEFSNFSIHSSMGLLYLATFKLFSF